MEPDSCLMQLNPDNEKATWDIYTHLADSELFINATSSASCDI